MTDTVNTATAPSAPTAPETGRRERTAWWIAFGVLTLAIVTMLGLWN